MGPATDWDLVCAWGSQQPAAPSPVTAAALTSKMMFRAPALVSFATLATLAAATPWNTPTTTATTTTTITVTATAPATTQTGTTCSTGPVQCCQSTELVRLPSPFHASNID